MMWRNIDQIGIHITMRRTEKFYQFMLVLTPSCDSLDTDSPSADSLDGVDTYMNPVLQICS